MEFDDLPKVEIFMYTDSDPELLKFMLGIYDGLVLAGTGSGNYHKDKRCFRKLYWRMYSRTCKSRIRGCCLIQMCLIQSNNSCL